MGQKLTKWRRVPFLRSTLFVRPSVCMTQQPQETLNWFLIKSIILGKSTKVVEFFQLLYPEVSQRDDYEDHCLLGLTQYTAKISAMSRQNILPPSSGSQSKQCQTTSKKQAQIAFRLTFDPEDGCNMFLRNIGELLSEYTASQRCEQYSSAPTCLCKATSI
jgi:hypothetical protein